MTKTMTNNDKIRTTARWAAWGCLAGLVLATAVILFALALIVGPVAGTSAAEMLEVQDIATTLPFAARAGGIAFWLATDLLGVWLFVTGYLLFRDVGAGAVYAPVTAARVRRLGWIVLAMAPVSMASELLGTAWVSFMSAGVREVGTGRVSLSIEGPDVYAVVIGLILLCFGHILSEAAEVAAENQSFV